MIAADAGTLALLLLWGTVVGLDLVSFPQGLLARPLVAAAVTGWLLGDLEAGLRVGAVLELFALDVLPVGASRYPEYGPGAIGATLLAAGLAGEGSVGIGVALGLVVALLAGYTLDWLRHANARHLHRLSDAVNSGSVAAIRTLQWSGLARDAARSAAVTLAGMTLALVALPRLGDPARLPSTLTPVLVGVGIAAALSGAVRTAGRGRRLVWLGIGLATGAVAVLGVLP